MGLFRSREEGRPRALWRLLFQIELFAVCSAVFGIPVVVLQLSAGTSEWLVFESGRGGESVELDLGRAMGSMVTEAPGLLVGSTAASLLAALVSVWVAGRFLDRRPLSGFGLRFGGGWFLDLGFGLSLGAVLMTAIFAVHWAAGWVEVTGAFESSAGGMPFALAILVPVLVFVGVGFYEELIFRGYVLTNMAEGLRFGPFGPRGALIAAWAFSSVGFGLMHALNPGATLASTALVALAGLMLGLGYVLTGELAIPIGLHIAWNFFQSAVYGFPVSGNAAMGATFLQTRTSGPELWTGGAFGPEGGLLDIGAVAVGCLLILFWVRIRRGKLGLCLPERRLPGPEAPAIKEGVPA